MNVLSLEKCKKLKEVGFPQNTLLSYHRSFGYLVITENYGDNVLVACPTFEEIWELLPNLTEYYLKSNPMFIGYYHPVGMQPFKVKNYTEEGLVLAAVEIWLELKDENLIP